MGKRKRERWGFGWGSKLGERPACCCFPNPHTAYIARKVKRRRAGGEGSLFFTDPRGEREQEKAMAVEKKCDD